jgi:hypothetical protein
MAEEKAEQKPEAGKSGVGKEKDEGAGAEVAGRSKLLLYICFNDGAGNYIDPSWTSFTCWRCGTHGYV